MDKCLVASCLAVGPLFLGGCGKRMVEGEEYHKWKEGNHVFSLSCIPLFEGSDCYISRLEVKGRGFVPNAGIDKVIVNTSGRPIYSNGPFNLKSVEYYASNKLSRRAEREDIGSDRRFKLEEELLSRDYIGIVNFLRTENNVSAFYEHVKECKGKGPCHIPKKK